MPKYPIDDTLLDEESVQIRIKKNRYNDCCINKNVCVSLSIVVCIILLIAGLTFINVYSLHVDDGSF